MNTGHVTETVQTVIVEQVIQTFNIEEITVINVVVLVSDSLRSYIWCVVPYFGLSYLLH